VEKIAEVFLSLMLEKKIFFVSDSQIVLGYVIESLLSFLYPLKWEHVILPILPEKLLQLLDAPVPLIAGIPTSLASDDLICSAKDVPFPLFRRLWSSWTATRSSPRTAASKPRR
jgi:hypothetical protein